MRLSPFLLFTPSEVLVRGFNLIPGLPSIREEDWNQCNVKKFTQHFGSSPTIISIIWNDIIASENRIDNKDKSEAGFKKLLRAIHFLWAYPKNAAITASSVGVGERSVQGERLWGWVRVISGLKDVKIVWPEDEYNDQDGRIYIVGVDGVDFRTWEKKDPRFPIDKGQYSHKFHHGALKYEIAIDCYTSRVVWISGPHKGLENNKTIFKSGLFQKIPDGKLVVADRGYSAQTDTAEYRAKMSIPNLCDSKETHNFKSRVRARHESFNGRIKFFRSLYDTYHHSHDKHVDVFEAVAVMVQYQMDNGSPLFEP